MIPHIFLIKWSKNHGNENCPLKKWKNNNFAFFKQKFILFTTFDFKLAYIGEFVFIMLEEFMKWSRNYNFSQNPLKLCHSSTWITSSLEDRFFAFAGNELHICTRVTYHTNATFYTKGYIYTCVYLCMCVFVYACICVCVYIYLG